MSYSYQQGQYQSNYQQAQAQPGQYQTGSAPGTGAAATQGQGRSADEQKTFLSKIKQNYSAKFGNLSLTSSIQRVSNYVDKDGDSEMDTLIHKAFVMYFDERGEAYPEWLGMPPPRANRAGAGGSGAYGGSYSAPGTSGAGAGSRFQPVYSSYNSPAPAPSSAPASGPSGPSGAGAGPSAGPSGANLDRPLPSTNQSAYKPRSSSRLQDMYNKSRQQHTPGGGYNTVNQGPNRTNSSTSGSRLRERMMNSGSMRE